MTKTAKYSSRIIPPPHPPRLPPRDGYRSRGTGSDVTAEFGALPISGLIKQAPLRLIKGWTVRYDNRKYFANQFYFLLFPSSCFPAPNMQPIFLSLFFCLLPKKIARNKAIMIAVDCGRSAMKSLVRFREPRAPRVHVLLAEKKHPEDDQGE